jgi:hypothetical protein
MNSSSCSDFWGFADSDETFEQVAAKIVKLVEKLQLKVDDDDVDELVESCDKELSNKELIELEAAKVADNEQHDNQKPEVQPKCFTVKDIRVAVQSLNNLYEAIERQDPDVSQFQRIVNDAFSYYKEVYEEKKRATVQTSLDQFIMRREEQPSTSTDPAFRGQPSSASCATTTTTPILASASFQNDSDSSIDY